MVLNERKCQKCQEKWLESTTRLSPGCWVDFTFVSSCDILWNTSALSPVCLAPVRNNCKKIKIEVLKSDAVCIGSSITIVSARDCTRDYSYH